MSLMNEVLAYAAGLFDGEGSIVIGLDKKRNSYWLQVRVTNTDMRLLEFLKKNFGGGIGTQGRAGPNYGAFRNRDCFFWCITSLGAEKFLRLILQYLIAKQPQAELAIEFQALARQKENGLRGKLTEKEVETRQSYKDRISALNMRHKRKIVQ